MTRSEKLKALASAATPGPWGVEQMDWVRTQYPSQRDPAWRDWICSASRFPEAMEASRNAAYIAACSPERILQLLAVVESMRGALRYYAETYVAARSTIGDSEWLDVSHIAEDALAALKAWEES